MGDLEICPWIDLNNHQGVMNLAQQLLRYEVGDLVFNIFVDMQDKRKAPSPHFRGQQGNVVVVHEANGEVVNASNKYEELVRDAVQKCTLLTSV